MTPRNAPGPAAERVSAGLWRAIIALLLLPLPILREPPSGRAAEPCEPAIARLVSVQGTVDVRRAATDPWQPGRLDDSLCVGDTVRVGAASRAALAFVNDSVLRLDALTTLRLRGLEEERRTLLDLVFGAVQFFSHRPRALEIDTPFVNSAAEGTEFLVRVAEDRAEVVMLAGRVRLTNPQGELLLAAGDAAIVPAGQAPQPQIVARPRDAVAWALYYPPVLTPLATGEPAGLPPGLSTAVARVSASDFSGALAALDEVPDAARDARYHTYRAGVLLNVGRVAAAEAAIEQALALDPAAGDALAQRAIIALTQSRREEALAEARRALELAPESSAAAIALSYALQGDFQLEAARAVLRQAVKQHPEDALAWARLSEIEQSFRELGRAREAAERAVALAPNLARTQMVLGFAALTRIDIDQAKATFERAIALDSANPLPRLGVGLAIIRSGHLAEGRKEIEIAAALDPNDSLIRSYLGKAYFEERRDPLDAEQYAIAKQLDPNDPTPWFYDAIRLQTVNRPVEALHNIQRSIELNDNRAVYRSRLLLDEDLAARGARLGRIYNDLGFEQLALIRGWESVQLDPSNYSAHRLLADTYAVLPRSEIARDSELLQSQLLQPININPVQPSLADDRFSILSDAGPSDVGLNEFTQLFASNGARLYGDVIKGSNNTLADNIIPSGIYNNVSFSAGQFYFDTDGFNKNNDFRQHIYNAFAQVSLTPSTSVQSELRIIDEKSGDPVLRFDPDLFVADERRELTRKIARVGLRHDFAPNSTSLSSYIYRDDDGELDQGPEGVGVVSDAHAHFGELRHLQQWRKLAVTAGFGHFKGESDNLVRFGPLPPIRQVSDLRHTNAYAYSYIAYPEDVIFTAGLSADAFEGVDLERDQLNPKLGVTWRVAGDTTLRAAAFRVLKRTLISSQTLEPTNVAGFNQFFDDVNGADIWRYGIAIDQQLGSDLFVGAEYAERSLAVPKLEADDDTIRSVTVDEQERLGRVYVYWAPADRWALSAEYRYERFKFDPAGSESRGLINAETHRVPVELQYFHPSGLFSGARATYVDQDARFIDFSSNTREGSDSFWTMDAVLGYRLPDRRGIITVQANNLLDRSFSFVDTDPDDPELSRDQVILGRLTLQF